MQGTADGVAPTPVAKLRSQLGGVHGSLAQLHGALRSDELQATAATPELERVRA